LSKPASPDDPRLPVRFSVASATPEEGLAAELPHADESYEISCGPSGCDVNASTVFGALYGVDTLGQLYASGRGPKTVSIKDKPASKYRGLMVDTGRRFVPMSWLETSLDGMFASRLNVLHLHLSDFGRMSLEIPNMTHQRDHSKGWYGKDEMRALIKAARSRGIRVVPEVDIPGHAQGLESLKPLGLQFCAVDGTRSTGVRPERSTALFDDPQGNTRRGLKALFTEVADIFEDPYVHMGGDEASGVGACTAENGAVLEKFVADTLTELRRTPIAWGDLAAATSYSPESKVGSNVVLEAWDRAAKGKHDVVDASIQSSYLDLSAAERPASNFWEPRLGGSHVLGGEAAIWTDNYCFSYQCGAASEDVGRAAGHLPKAPGMYGRGADATFESSLSGLVWPRAFVKGAALWHRDPHVNVGAVLDAAHARLETSVNACPQGCVCDEVRRCGEVFQIPGMDDNAVSACYSAQPVNAEVVEEDAGDRSSAFRLCAWRKCDAVACDGDTCSLLATTNFAEATTAFVPIQGCLKLEG
jgi:hexosaminidase